MTESLSLMRCLVKLKAQMPSLVAEGGGTFAAASVSLHFKTIFQTWISGVSLDSWNSAVSASPAPGLQACCAQLFSKCPGSELGSSCLYISTSLPDPSRQPLDFFLQTGSFSEPLCCLQHPCMTIIHVFRVAYSIYSLEPTHSCLSATATLAKVLSWRAQQRASHESHPCYHALLVSSAH